MVCNVISHTRASTCSHSPPPNTHTASLNLFGVLESAPAGMTVDEIRQKLQLTADRGVVDWLDALVALQLLHREGNGPSAVYTNTVRWC